MGMHVQIATFARLSRFGPLRYDLSAQAGYLPVLMQGAYLSDPAMAAH